jgi:hypothetical protein
MFKMFKITAAVAGGMCLVKQLSDIDYYNLPHFACKFARSPVHTGKILRINIKIRRGKIISGKEFKYAFKPYMGQLVKGIQHRRFQTDSAGETIPGTLGHYSESDPTYRYNIGGINISRTIDLSDSADFGPGGIYFCPKTSYMRYHPIILSVSVFDDTQLKVYTKKDSENRHIIFGDPQPFMIKADKVILDYRCAVRPTKKLKKIFKKKLSIKRCKINSSIQEVE